jgi:hypothetical protein
MALQHSSIAEDASGKDLCFHVVTVLYKSTTSSQARCTTEENNQSSITDVSPCTWTSGLNLTNCHSGFTGDESKAICQQLDAAGFDLIELSGGTYESLTDGFGHSYWGCSHGALTKDVYGKQPNVSLSSPDPVNTAPPEEAEMNSVAAQVRT